MRVHLAFRQLAMRLNRAGLPVLRFDYLCSGDSYGTSADVSMEGCRRSTHAAIDALVQTTGISRVVLIGLRLGAAVAAQTAASRTDVATLVLWEPVITGSRYLAELAASPTTDRSEACWWVNGYPLPPDFRAEIGNIDLNQIEFTHTSRVIELVGVSGERLGQIERERQLETVELAMAGLWNEPDGRGSIFVPAVDIREIVRRLTA